MNLKITRTEFSEVAYNSPIKVSSNIFESREILKISFKADEQAYETELNLLHGFHLTTYTEALELFENPEKYQSWPEEIKFVFELAIFLEHYLEKLNDEIYLSPYFDPGQSSSMPNLEFSKIKIARQPFEDERYIIKAMQEKKVRLDANKCLSFDDFKKYASLLTDYDYFEDPFKNPKLMINFPNERFALDESVLDDELWKLKQVTTFILKPSALGLGNTIELIKVAKQIGKRVVISSTFESEKGHMALAALAAYSDMALGYREHHGLGTISLLKGSLTLGKLDIRESSACLKFKS
jgi:hypothetical protein